MSISRKLINKKGKLNEICKIIPQNFKRLLENEIFISDQKIKHEYVNQLNLIEIYPSLKQNVLFEVILILIKGYEI